MDQEDIDRYSASFSGMLTEQRRKLDDGVRAVADALQRAAVSLASNPAVAGVGGAVATGPAMPADKTGVVAVRVVNDKVPVTVVADAEKKADKKTEGGSGGGGFWGAVSGVLGGIGNLVGGIIQGGITGLVGGVGLGVFGGELIAALVLARPLLDQAKGLLDQATALTDLMTFRVLELITATFAELTKAGIFPVSSLLTTVLAFVDLGLVIVLAQLGQAMAWVEKLAMTLFTWLGQFISGVSTWIGGLVNSLTGFLGTYVTYLITGVVKPAAIDLVVGVMQTVAQAVVGSAYVLGSEIRESLHWGVEYLKHEFFDALSKSGFPVSVPPAPAPYNLRIEAAGDLAAQSARNAVRSRLEQVLGPLPPEAATSTVSPSGVPYGPPPPPVLKPELRTPTFPMPKLELLPAPSFAPRLPGFLGAPADGLTPKPAEPTGQAPITVPRAPAAPVQQAPVTFNGGITVHIAAADVDAEDAAATGRRIARNVLDELRRLTERDRFRTGLPTSAIT